MIVSKEIVENQQRVPDFFKKQRKKDVNSYIADKEKK